MKIKFITFGCKVNAGEDQLYLSQLIEQGFLEAKDIDEADENSIDYYEDYVK